MPQIVHQISFGSEQLPLKIGNIELPCFILDNRQAVFTKNGLQKALGYDGKSEDWLFDFLGSINKFYPIQGELFEAFENPILFEVTAKDGNKIVCNGMATYILLMTCQTIVNAKADGYLSVGQLKHARAAQAIAQFASQYNLNEAVAQASGFNFAKESGKTYLEQFLVRQTNDPAYHWVHTFRDAFFDALLQQQSLEWVDLRDKPQEISRLLYETIFSRIPDNLLNELRSNKPKRSYRRNGKVSDTEHPALKEYLSEILSLLKAAADNWTIFLQLLNRIHPKKNNTELQLEHPVAVPAISEEPLHLLIKKGLEINKTYKKHK
ncbi:P63C domain-containing protein [Flavobacterium sp.]|uniref:P63C domain-containing protein n=1 Tax=Flavobacterium sp. TaxID=239 RepID=UPI0039E3B2A0